MSFTTPRFIFFDKEPIRDPDQDGQVFDKLKDLKITCSSAGSGQIAVGEENGGVIILDKHFSIVGFPGFSKTITHMHQLRQHNLLFCVGEDYDIQLPLIKVYNMDKMDANKPPYCSRIFKLVFDKEGRTSKVTALAVHENLQLMAVGFFDGNIMLFQGDITKDKNCRHHMLADHMVRKEPVTGLGLSAVGKAPVLYATYAKALLSWDISTKDKDTPILNESYGCSAGCCAMADEVLQHQFLIGRDDGVYFIQPEGRGASVPLEGEKTKMFLHRGYLVTVGKSNIGHDKDIVTVYDTVNKFIAYQGPISRVISVLFEWGAIYVLGGDNQFFVLLEKPTQNKLEMLFKKNQYQTAINIAKSQQLDPHGLSDIHRQYADYLYAERNEFDRAIEQYIKTIGTLEASYVIRKFLDAQRIHNLTLYLEELHNKHCATEDHTTLLLNCYTKLKDEEKIDQFIQQKDGNKGTNFEVETAIKVLRQADYHKHALQLAQRHGKHSWYMKIQLENIKDFRSALQYMHNLSFQEAVSNLKRYGHVLMNAVPKETTEFLKKLCLGQFEDGTNRAKPDEFVPIFVNSSIQLIDFLEAMISSEMTPELAVYGTLLELYLQGWAHETDLKQRQIRERKTLDLLLRSPRKVIDQDLVLCQLHKFRPGILYLYEKAELYQQIVQYYMDNDDYKNIIESCTKWGGKDTQLWVEALTYFAQREDNCKEQMKEVLDNIDSQKLLPPLLVMQTLANSRVCTLGVIKEFIVKRLKEENQQLEEDEKMIKQYADETSTIRERIYDLKHNPQVFQLVKCSVCSQPLELPAVHFLCRHSYHLHCFESFAENENECPACMDENRKLLESIKQQDRSKNRDLMDSFQREMKSSRDGFDVIANYFSKGIFNKNTVLPESSSSAALKEDMSSSRVTRYNPFNGQNSEGVTDKYQPDISQPSTTRADGLPIASLSTAASGKYQPAAGFKSSTPISISSVYQASAVASSKGQAQKREPYDEFGQSPQLDIVSLKPRTKNQNPVGSSSLIAKPSPATHSVTNSSFLSVAAGSDLGTSVSAQRTSTGGSSTLPRSSSAAPLSSQDLAQGPGVTSTTINRQGAPQTQLGVVVSDTAKNAKPHVRNLSAGKLLDTGLSFITSQLKPQSESSVKPVQKKPTDPKPIQKAGDSYNPFEEKTLDRPRLSQSLKTSTGPRSGVTSLNQPATAKALNPFEQPTPTARGIKSPASNPFEDPPAARSTESAAALSNPFEEDDQQGGNPFE